MSPEIKIINKTDKSRTVVILKGTLSNEDLIDRKWDFEPNYYNDFVAQNFYNTEIGCGIILHACATKKEIKDTYFYLSSKIIEKLNPSANKEYSLKRYRKGNIYLIDDWHLSREVYFAIKLPPYTGFIFSMFLK